MFIFLIEEIRKEKNMTQSELSKKTGISRSYIAELESSTKVNVSFETIYKIAQALEVEISKIFVAVSDIEEARIMLYDSMNEKGINSKEALKISRLIDKHINLESKKMQKNALSKNEFLGNLSKIST